MVCPVLAQLLRTKHEDIFVPLLEPFDGGERGERFPKPDAIGEDAATMLFDFREHGAEAVALEVEQHSPDGRLLKRCSFEECILLLPVDQTLTEEVEERLEVDELGRCMGIACLQRSQDFPPDVLGQVRVGPEFIEPSQQVFAVAIAVHDEVEFQVWRTAKTEAVDGEVRAADQRVRTATVIDMEQLAVQEAGAPYRLDLDPLLDPLRTAKGRGALPDLFREAQAFLV